MESRDCRARLPRPHHRNSLRSSYAEVRRPRRIECPAVRYLTSVFSFGGDSGACPGRGIG